MEKKKTKEMLEDEIRSMILDLNTLQPGSEEKREAIETLAILYELKIEERKVDLENLEKINRSRDSHFKLYLDAAAIVVPMITYGVWINRGFKFEETGTVTSFVFKSLIGRLNPFK